MTVTTYYGDCIEILPTLAPGSVQCIVTSPQVINTDIS